MITWNQINEVIPAVILSGGSEIVAVAVAEALLPSRVPLVVIGLGKSSIIRDVHPNLIYRQIEWPPPSQSMALSTLITILQDLGAGEPSPWPVFATEDGGLRLLLAERHQLSPYLAFAAGSSRLLWGGLDKAELFQALSQSNLAHLAAPTVVLNDPSEAISALEQFGGRAVFKPSLKPLSMDLNLLGGKAFAVDVKDDKDEVVRQLRRAWPVAQQWIAQPHLLTPRDGEAMWWGIRTKNGQIMGVTAYERWKYPAMGGSACWAETAEIPGLHDLAVQILETLDFHGVTDLAFLYDEQEDWRLLEINVRPWLQVGLTAQSNLPLIYMLYQDLLGLEHEMAGLPFGAWGKSWVNVERMLLAALSGKQGSRLKTFWDSMRVIYRSDYKAIYSTSLPKVRSRWIWRMIKKLIG